MISNYRHLCLEPNEHDVGALASGLPLLSWGPFLLSLENLFGPEKPFIKLPLAYSVKLVFSYFVKGVIQLQRELCH